MAIFSFRQKTLADYFLTNEPPKRVPVAIRHKARLLTTVIARTSALTDGTCRIVSLQPHECSVAALTTAAHCAFINDQSTLTTQLLAALPTHPTVTAKPIRTGATPWHYSIWHHGAGVKTYWVGDIRLLEVASNITENERDRLYQTAGNAHAKGNLVVIIGESTAATTEKHIPPIILRGIIIYEPQLRFGTASAIETLARHNVTVCYLSSQPIYYVSTIAHRAGLLHRTDTPSSRTITGLPLHKSVYAELTAGDEARVLATYNAEKTTVVTQSLHEFMKRYQHLVR